MNLIYMVLRVMSVLGEKYNGVKTTASKIWAPPRLAVETMARNVIIFMAKPLETFDGFYRSMKRCV